MKTTLAIIMLCLGTTLAQAQRSFQVEIAVDVLSVRKSDFDTLTLALSKPLDAKAILQLRRGGKAELLYSPRLIARNGTEGVVKAVQEVIYPTDLSVYLPTNAPKRDVVMAQSDYEMREVGVILQAVPEVSHTHDEIALIVNLGIIEPPEWTQYLGKYVSADGAERTVALPQPIFYHQCFNASVMLKDGETVLISGGVPSRDKSHVVFALVTARIIGSDGEGLRLQAETHEN